MGRLTGADIEDIEYDSLDVDVHLPKFPRVRTDDLADSSDKPDDGITLLDRIRSSNESLAEGQGELIEGQAALRDDAGTIAATTETMVDQQSELISLLKNDS